MITCPKKNGQSIQIRKAIIFEYVVGLVVDAENRIIEGELNDPRIPHKVFKPEPPDGNSGLNDLKSIQLHGSLEGIRGNDNIRYQI